MTAGSGRRSASGPGAAQRTAALARAARRDACSARLRLPLVEADERETAVVREMLERHGLLAAAGRA